MKVCSRLFVAGVVLVGLLFVAGCGGSHPPVSDPQLSGRVGENCTIYFRRDALGMAAGAPSPPRTGNQNGADVAMSGKLLRVNPGWLTVGIDQAEYTIPREVILMIEVKAK
jgi:hypothetical protein